MHTNYQNKTRIQIKLNLLFIYFSKVTSFHRTVPTDEVEYDPLEDDDYEAYDDYSTEKDLESKPSRIDVERVEVDPEKAENKSNTKKVHTQSSPTQKQTAAVNVPKYSLTQSQNGRAVAHPSSTTESSVPDGFKGKIEHKKYQTRFLPSKHKSIENDAKEKSKPDTFVTVTKSVTGSLDNSQQPESDDKKFEQTFYTKSSTCGYFTFSCNIVYGSNGRSKICRPKQPTNGKC